MLGNGPLAHASEKVRSQGQVAIGKIDIKKYRNFSERISRGGTAPRPPSKILSIPAFPRYTSFSELYPILAAGNLPFVKVGEISQTINVNAQLLSNTVTFEGPVSTSTFVAEASFEVRSPMRLQVLILSRC